MRVSIPTACDMMTGYSEARGSFHRVANCLAPQSRLASLSTVEYMQT